MSIDTKGAQQFASAEKFGSGFSNAIKGFLYGAVKRGGGKNKGKKGGFQPVTAEDWENQEIANSHAQRRDQINWQLGEHSKMNDATLRQSEANAKHIRDVGMLDQIGNRNLGRFDVTEHGISAGGAKGAAIKDKFETPVRAPRTSTAPRAGSAKDSIAPAKSTIVRGQQTGGGKSTGGVTK